MAGARRFRMEVVVLAVVVSGATGEGSGAAGASERRPRSVRSAGDAHGFPPPAHAAVSAAIGAADPSYHARKTPAGYRLENARHRLAMDLAADGVRVSAPAQEWRFRFRGLGRDAVTAAANPVAPRPVSAVANRVEYRRESVTEWYVNSPSGLEQGFTLDSPPSGDRGRPVRLTMDVAGDATEDGSGGLRLAGPEGWRYRGLFALDAVGRELRSRLGVRDGRVTIEVDDRDALYPLTVDPLFQTAKLTASDAGQNDELGYSVAVSGETVVVGAPFANTNAGATVDAGAAYVFQMGVTGWTSMTQTAKLTASDGAAFDFFGFTVAIDGDTIVVGALDDDLGAGSNQGSAYVFVRPGVAWVDATETAKLTASDAATSDEFGCAVAVSRDVVAVGSRYADNGPSSPGAVYVFVKPGGGWATTTETAKLTASDGMPSDQLGASVAIDRDTIIAGAPGKDGASANEGAAYVYEEPGGGWASGTQTAKLTALVPGGLDELGISVALVGNTAVVGAWGAEVGANTSQGAAYVYVRPGGAWANATETARLTASDGDAGDFFGVSVATGGDAVVVGSYQDDVGTASSQGSAYLFVAPPAGWANATEAQKLVASDGAAGDEFGRSVAMGEGVAVVGSHLSSTTNEGAAYVFDVPIPTSFFTLPPCRVLDTRNPPGALGGPALFAGADREFTLAGVCGIPPTALAVSVTVAVTGPTAVGNLRLHPGGSAVPVVSSLNYSGGQTRSNNAIVRLSAAGSLAAFVGQTSGTVHFILDVNGYFQP